MLKMKELDWKRIMININSSYLIMLTKYQFSTDTLK